MHPTPLNFARSRARRDLGGLKLSATSGIDDCPIALESRPVTPARHSARSRLLVCGAVIGRVMICVENGE